MGEKNRTTKGGAETDSANYKIQTGQIQTGQYQDDYIVFNAKRLANTDFQAEKKIKAIDELADIIFAARNWYKKNATPRESVGKNKKL